jgi:tetratricopeptide (TPR) repeat protein
MQAARDAAERVPAVLADLAAWDAPPKSGGDWKPASAGKWLQGLPSYRTESAAAPAPADGLVVDAVAKRSASSEKAKAAGNSLFAKGDRAGAVKMYSKALADWPENTAARCNRAFARLKVSAAELKKVDVQLTDILDDATSSELAAMGRQISALSGGSSATCEPRWANLVHVVRDCSLVLETDAGFVKAWHRRGLARSEMARLALLAGGSSKDADKERFQRASEVTIALLDASLPDFRRALELDPKNAATGKELAAVERRLETAKLELSFSVTPPAKKAPDEHLTPAPTPVSAAFPDGPSDSGPRVVEVTEEEARSIERASANAAPDPIPELVVPEVQIQLPRTPPTTAYEFEAFWRSARGSSVKNSAELLFSYVRMLSPQAAASLFVRAISADLFSEMLQVCVLCGAGTADTESALFIKQLLLEFRRTARFDMNTMFFSFADKEGLRDLLNGLEGRPEVLSPDDAQVIRKAYGV